jgi:hypothetical protein
MVVALGLLLILAGAVFASTGWLGSPRTANAKKSRDAALHYRNADPHHWRACVLQP